MDLYEVSFEGKVIALIPEGSALTGALIQTLIEHTLGANDTLNIARVTR